MLRPLCVLAAILAARHAAAVHTRPDRDDSEYLELASRYQAAVKLPAVIGEGVLIAPRWVLTSPAPALLLRAITPTPSITVGAREYEIDSIHSSEDLALVFLTEPVTDVAPASPYRESDEAGKGVAIVG